MNASNVFPKATALTETDYKQKLAKGLRRVMMAEGPARFAAKVPGCCAKTLSNAASETHALNPTVAFNLLVADPTALDELLAHFGFRLERVEAVEGEDARLLADTMALASEHAEAMADGRVDHIEEARLVKKARPVAMAWNARIAKAGAA